MTRTRDALGEAAERATALGSLDSAVSLFEAALELTPAGEPGRPMLLYGYCDALELIGRTDPAVLSTTIDELTQAGEAAAAATLETVLGWERTDAGYGDEAGQAFARAEALVASAPASREKARALAGLATAMALRGDREQAVVLGREAVELAETFGDA